jgi:hypothetical protein
VRLTIVDFPTGTLSGTWQEVTCVVNDRWYQVVGLDLPENTRNGPAHEDFAITGSGTPSSFTINVTTDTDNTFSGGLGVLPFGVSGYGLWYPDRLPKENSRPRLFLLTGGSKAAVFYPASDYNPMGACGALPVPKLAPAKP